MPKKAKELGPLAVKRLTTPGKHPVGGVAGLYLKVISEHARSWVLRVAVAGQRREIGLGAYAESGMGVAAARVKALAVREDIARGVDPVMQKKEAKSRLRASQALEMTFEQAAKRFIKVKEPEWRRDSRERRGRERRPAMVGFFAYVLDANGRLLLQTAFEIES
ncbi:uncharacterized protein DUF4102 [Paraburkholderia sp. RAU2J]|uniref:Arm DNA-binding domain-containing protein n=1 Tax=Paraburkholderia sp. RAU2J TaxID=1938810 RepID=UPI000EB18901|nr:Arm DNA-binding domain-containing protein [Paraburkholderia sp. RAU2J]RKT24769.1 uncharacterized protein DUF4102 [Paraburkholderia sp. RAU2J]